MKTKSAPVPSPVARTTADQQRLAYDLTVALNSGSSILIPKDRQGFQTLIDNDLVCSKNLSADAKIMLIWYLLRGPKWLTTNVAANMKSAFGWSKNTAGKYLRELVAAGYAFRICAPDIFGMPGAHSYMWKFSMRPAGLPEDQLIDRIWKVETLQYGLHKDKARVSVPVKDKPGEYKLGYPAARFEGMVPNLDFDPQDTYGNSFWADVEITENNDGTATKTLTQIPLEKDRKVNKVIVKRTQPRKANKKAVSNEATVEKVEVPKIGRLSKLETTCRILTYSPIETREIPTSSERRVLIRRKKRAKLRESPYDKLTDDTSTYGLNPDDYKMTDKRIDELSLPSFIPVTHNSSQPEITTPPVEQETNKSVYSKPEVFFWPKTDYPGSPPIVAHNDKYSLTQHANYKPLPDPVLEIPEKEINDPYVDIPDYDYRVLRVEAEQYIKFLQRKLKRPPTLEEIHAQLDKLNPEKQNQ